MIVIITVIIDDYDDIYDHYADDYDGIRTPYPVSIRIELYILRDYKRSCGFHR